MSKIVPKFAWLFVPSIFLGFLSTGSAAQPTITPTIDVLFSPNGGCTDRIVQEVAAAKHRIRIQAYSFTSATIAKAILEAKKRGLDCEVILDKSQPAQNYSELDFFFNQGVPTLIDDQHAIAHNKIILIDDTTIVTGSFNFTKAAEETNAENVLVIKDDADLARKYAENYAKHREHSRIYQGRTTTPDAARAPPVAGEQNKSSPDSADEIVYVTRTGSKYHRAGCGSLSKSQIPMKLSEAKQRHAPCSRCRPPT